MQNPYPNGTGQQGSPQQTFPAAGYPQNANPQQNPQQTFPTAGYPQNANRQQQAQPSYPQGQAYSAQQAVPQVKKKKSHAGTVVLTILGVLLVGFLGFLGFVWLFGNDPAPIPYPVNPDTPDDIEEILKGLTEIEAVLTPTENGGYLYTDDDAEVTLSVGSPAMLSEEIRTSSSGDAAPSVITGKSGDTAYTAVTTPEIIVVYVTTGDKTVRAESKNDSADKQTKAIRKTASVAASTVTAARLKEAYAKDRDDYNHNHAAYFMEIADCLIFYPAQLTEKQAFEDQSVIFSDKRSSASCSVKLEYNPYRNIKELESLMKNSPNNTVLAVGDDWMTSEIIQNGTVTFTYTGFGSKYMVTAQLSYPRKYSFVFDELRELLRCRFIEGGKWKSGSRPARASRTYGAPTYGMQDIFYEDHDLYLALPDTLDEQDNSADTIVFHDFTNGKSATVNLFKIASNRADNLFDVFDVIAADGDVVLGDDYVRWHNKYGMYVGTVYDTDAALLSFEGEATYHAYEAVYDELICHFVPTYFEDQPVAPAKRPVSGEGTKPLEDQPVSGSTDDTDDNDPEPQDISGDKPVEPRKQPVPAPVPPNIIDDVNHEKVVSETRREITDPQNTDTPANNPLIYYTDADRIAANSTVWDWGSLSVSGRSSLLDTLLTILAYNGYHHEVEYAPGAAIIQDDMNEMLDDMIFAHPILFADELEGSIPQDIFPYFCDALNMDFIPEYRARSESALPEPDWVAALKDEENYDPDALAWGIIRQILEEGEDPSDYPADTLYTEDISPAAPPPQDSGSVTVGRSQISTDAGELRWNEYGIRFSSAEVLETEKQIAEWFWETYDAVDAERQQKEGNTVFWYPEDSDLDFHLAGPPDFDSVGSFNDEDVGIYKGMRNDMTGIEPEIADTEYFGISGDGIWILYDSAAGRVLDYGILVPDSEGDMFYTINTEGEFTVIWFWDIGTLSTSKYGWLEIIR